MEFFPSKPATWNTAGSHGKSHRVLRLHLHGICLWLNHIISAWWFALATGLGNDHLQGAGYVAFPASNAEVSIQKQDEKACNKREACMR